MKIQITDSAFNAWTSLQDYEQTLSKQHGKYGAVATFVGTMRNYNEGDTVKSMFLEHYPEMTEKYLRKISEEALKQWDILDTLIIHRVGNIEPSETIVLVATWAGHRVPALGACRYLIEELKHRAPFWKREILDNGERWVKQNTKA